MTKEQIRKLNNIKLVRQLTLYADLSGEENIHTQNFADEVLYRLETADAPKTVVEDVDVEGIPRVQFLRRQEIAINELKLENKRQQSTINELERTIRRQEGQVSRQGEQIAKLEKTIGLTSKVSGLKEIVALLHHLHAFNKLNNVIIELIEQATGVDAKKLCEIEGITYDISSPPEEIKTQPKITVEFDYSIGDEVWIKEIERTGKIISLWYTAIGQKYQCRWTDDGKFHEEYLFEDEISTKFKTTVPKKF